MGYRADCILQQSQEQQQGVNSYRLVLNSQLSHVHSFGASQVIFVVRKHLTAPDRARTEDRMDHRICIKAAVHLVIDDNDFRIQNRSSAFTSVIERPFTSSS